MSELQPALRKRNEITVVNSRWIRTLASPGIHLAWVASKLATLFSSWGERDKSLANSPPSIPFFFLPDVMYNSLRNRFVLADL